MRVEKLNDHENFILQKLIADFLQRVESDKNGSGYYWKWTYTWSFALRNKWPTKPIRETLNRLEKKGYVHSKRSSNSIGWCANLIEGYEPHSQFSDYLQPKKTS